MVKVNLHPSVYEWIDEMAKLTKPDKIVWIDGSEEEKQRLIKEALESGELMELNQEKLPGCYLHRTHPSDVARVEDRTFICTPTKEEAGPTNNWMDPNEAYKMLYSLFDGSMKGRTMYVVPYLMGPVGSPYSKVGIELTDSIYVVLNLRIMARIGDVALKHLGSSPDFVKGLHSKATLDPEKRYICHFPQDNTIMSVNSGYGGNVILSKKCFALRIASYLGRKEGWLAEHMLIVGIEDPSGKVTYIAGAFPSACGKTNLAMLIPPEPLKKLGYKVWTVGDDIAWMRIGEDGRLWAINPEAGFFGVAPGTSYKTNPNAMETIKRNTIYTNVLLKEDGTVWWEGMDGEPPERGIDWLGRPWTKDSGEKGAHPNARFTAPAAQCPSISKEWENPNGVPISAIIFGGRRAKVAPLVYEAFDWQHGVYVGATMASETTAAAMGKVGVVRRDPMAMLPFCGYNMADYFAHWLEMGKKIPNPPKIFHVNWFRQDENGKFIWPGFGENLRVLKWIIERCEGKVEAKETPIGYVPYVDDLYLDGLDIDKQTVEKLLEIDKELWLKEAEASREFLSQFRDRLPRELIEENEKLKQRLSK
ncbi:Phosphoenolpyruvate carboxykinase (GTP) [Caldicellulosiruptor hydrothermalis 108]|uniref:Phosphoenolpyruvate carboxykinase [GTP] n=1 Tax=Caldicellulosiruptor hydrothermalis (strain DSM 18901 / VKM B-2411 / 108) TaxID=632292 RepID=E4Q8B4_CALH1|nr:phosphoenolpyruvate carboxykinase (GTP) [Caldicellulosiruptor hydrothermalis]ADQ07961.1 Phosphoenolpyruvate carboxykinase (GTP) [Caldicellulosiruptor hydrothermalis 108]